MEIGQFLNTKNKVEMRKNTLINMIVATIVGIAVPILSNIAPVRTVKATVVTMIGKRVGKSFFMSISLPSLVRKILSLIKVVFEKKNIVNGTNIKVSQNTTEAMIGKSLIAEAVENPALIPNQKTKFQNLSLLILSEKTLLSKLGWFLQNVAKSSMVFSYNLWFQIYSIIISKYYRLSKQIKVLILVISLSLCGNNVFAADGQVNGQIEQLIKNTEQQYSIPSGLLVAIAKIESGMNAYALNVNGKSVLASNSREASSLIASARKVGISNIDVGIMQLNYRWHASGFASIQEMLNPQRNIEYAASFLLRLKKQHGTWHKALRYYHSAKPEHHRKYSRKVVLCWLNEQSSKF
jgi:soluble lytic murein transglycosylase-like protein